MTRRDLTSMWADACTALARAERLHRQFFDARSTPRGEPPTWEAPADVFERGPELTVWVALPGVRPEEIEVAVEGTTLRVSGVRRLQVTPSAAVIRRLEIPHGRFERQIDLPAGEYALEALEALNGCLHLRLRRR